MDLQELDKSMWWRKSRPMAALSAERRYALSRSSIPAGMSSRRMVKTLASRATRKKDGVLGSCFRPRVRKRRDAMRRRMEAVSKLTKLPCWDTNLAYAVWAYGTVMVCKEGLRCLCAKLSLEVYEAGMTGLVRPAIRAQHSPSVRREGEDMQHHVELDVVDHEHGVTRKGSR